MFFCYWFALFLLLVLPLLGMWEKKKSSSPIDIPTITQGLKSYKKGNLDDCFFLFQKNKKSISGTYADNIFFLEESCGISEVFLNTKKNNISTFKSQKEMNFVACDSATDGLKNEPFIKAIREQIYFYKYSDAGELKSLIKQHNKADVTITGEMKMTLLHLVAWQKIPIQKDKNRDQQIACLLEIIQILKDRGANMEAKNDFGKTAYDLAKILKKPQKIIDALKFK